MRTASRAVVTKAIIRTRDYESRSGVFAWCSGDATAVKEEDAREREGEMGSSGCRRMTFRCMESIRRETRIRTNMRGTNRSARGGGGGSDIAAAAATAA